MWVERGSLVPLAPSLATPLVQYSLLGVFEKLVFEILF